MAGRTASNSLAHPDRCGWSASPHNNGIAIPDIIETTAAFGVALFQTSAETRLGVTAAP